MLASLLLVVLLGILNWWHGLLLDPFISSIYRENLHRALIVALAVALFLCLDRFLRRHYWHGYLKQRRNREAPKIIQDAVTIVLLSFGLGWGLWRIGVLTSSTFFTTVVAVAGALAFVAGQTLQPIILDLYSGIAINFDRSYGLGDWLTIYSPDGSAPIFGRVTGITWRTTFLRLEDQTVLAVPNRLAALNPMVNHTREPHTQELTVDVSLDIRLSPDRLLEMLLGETLKTVCKKNGLANVPEPGVVLSRISDCAAVYQVKFHSHPDRIAPRDARSLVLRALLDAIQQLRVPLPASQVELGKAPETRHDHGIEEIVEALLRVRLFRDVLDSDEAQTLARHCSSLTVPRDHLLMKQGAQGSSLFIILEGAACVWITGKSGERKDVATLAMGDIVGEMSLLTGAPRNASVSALTAMRVLEVTKEAMAELVKTSPEILQRFSQVLSTRQLELEAIVRDDSDGAATQRDLLARMLSFFSYPFTGSRE